jgi:hypothetical protein
MLHYAAASSLWVHGNSSGDGSERALNSPETQCSIGFQPVSPGVVSGFTWKSQNERFALKGREDTDLTYSLTEVIPPELALPEPQASL